MGWGSRGGLRVEGVVRVGGVKGLWGGRVRPHHSDA